MYCWTLWVLLRATSPWLERHSTPPPKKKKKKNLSRERYKTIFLERTRVETAAVETAIAQCTSCWEMARGHRLNTSIVLAAVHGLSSLFRTVSAVEPSLSHPLPTLSPSLIGHLASVNVKLHESKDEGV